MPQGYDPRERRNGRPAGSNTNKNRRPSDERTRPRSSGPQQQRSVQRRPSSSQPRPQQRPAPMPAPVPEQAADYSTTIKGIIAVFLTLLIVIIIVMLFAKSLFVSGEELAKNIKTGHLTETEYLAIEAPEDLNEEVVTTKKAKKKTTAKKEEEEKKTVELPADLDTSIAGTYMVNDPVYLHPTPDSQSENLATLPYGAEIQVYGSSNYGWYYVEYNGQYGYAYGTYFTKQN